MAAEAEEIEAERGFGKEWGGGGERFRIRIRGIGDDEGNGTSERLEKLKTAVRNC
jgi:hypothetical protein